MAGRTEQSLQGGCHADSLKVAVMAGIPSHVGVL